jgi:8-oxo-dGTP pyrophosphatase MutT (NUDIX family)
MSSSFKTRLQVSSGGVAYRRQGDKVEVALISVGPAARWQLPKGALKKGETEEQAALREVREETGLLTEVVERIDAIQYWFYAGTGSNRIRFFKTVHFFLLRYVAGDVGEHDQEVNEARWVEIGAAVEMLSFESEKKIVRQARELIAGLGEA